MADGLCAEERARAELNPELEEALHTLYDAEAARAIRFLLNDASEETISRFAYTFLEPERLAVKAGVDIIVRPIADKRLMKGNIGHYLIFTQKHNTETLLKFTNQASCVYYLMYLIDRKQHANGPLPILNLRRNMDSFIRLYQLVYDIHHDSVLERFRQLLYREDVLGMKRVGRERECIFDIRTHLKQHFESYRESYFPYAMTAHSHLSVSTEHIRFEDKAQKLLDLEFKS